MIKEQLGDQLVGHISRDATAIVAREKPKHKSVESVSTDEASGTQTKQHQRGRPRADEVRQPRESTRIARQRQQDVAEMLTELPKDCDHGTKCNAQGYKTSWNGYKPHLDTADCGVPISAVLTSASVHDRQVAVPLSRLSAQTNDQPVRPTGATKNRCRDAPVGYPHSKTMKIVSKTPV